MNDKKEEKWLCQRCGHPLPYKLEDHLKIDAPTEMKCTKCGLIYVKTTWDGR